MKILLETLFSEMLESFIYASLHTGNTSEDKLCWHCARHLLHRGGQNGYVVPSCFLGLSLVQMQGALTWHLEYNIQM